MDVRKIIEKADGGSGLTVEDIEVYHEAVKPIKHVYGKYGTLKKKYLEEKGLDWTIANLPEFLHGIDKQADEMYEVIYNKLLRDEKFKSTGNFMENYRRQTEIQRIIEEEILNELIYTEEVV